MLGKGNSLSFSTVLCLRILFEMLLGTDCVKIKVRLLYLLNIVLGMPLPWNKHRVGLFRP
jgi:hypothetical protein